MDEIAQAPQTPESTQQLNQSSADDLPKKSGKIRKIFNASSWFVFFALLPVTGLILLSQNTIPGDLFYPIKRGMENVVLAAARASPATRVAFRTDLTERRFDEAEKLLLARADTTGLSDFVEEVQTAQQEVSTLSNLASKRELTEKLIKKIDEYQNKLVQIQEKRQANPVVPALPTNTPVPLVIESEPTSAAQPTSASLQNPTVTPFTKIFRVTPSPTSAIQQVTPTSTQQIVTPKPTSIKTSVVPTTQPTPTQTQPTEVQIEPTIEPTITGSSNPPNDANDDIESAIEDTQERLDEIKDELEKGRNGGRDKKEKDDEGDEKTNVTDQEDQEEEDQEDQEEKSGKRDGH